MPAETRKVRSTKHKTIVHALQRATIEHLILIELLIIPVPFVPREQRAAGLQANRPQAECCLYSRMTRRSG
jgi:hypothetical protein